MNIMSKWVVLDAGCTVFEVTLKFWLLGKMFVMFLL